VRAVIRTYAITVWAKWAKVIRKRRKLTGIRVALCNATFRIAQTFAQSLPTEKILAKQE